MPLMLLGLILLLGILAYALYNYRRGSDDSMVSNARRERERSRNQSQSFREEPEQPEQKVLYFPTDNVEVEKRKRNI